MSQTGAPERLTTRTYWDHGWANASEGRRRAKRLQWLQQLDSQTAAFLLQSVELARTGDRRPRILEIGCANSIWLPFLGRETGSDVVGVDYSERGCRLAELNLSAAGVEGRIVCADLFDFIKTAPAPFDFIISFGLIEHFSDVTSVLRSMRSIVRPGGVLAATVPNLAGIYGTLQGLIDKQILDQHVILTPEELAAHATEAGLQEVVAGPIGGSLRLSSINVAHIRWLPRTLTRAIPWGLSRFDRVVAAAARFSGRPPTSLYVSPYLYVRGITAL